MTSPAEELVLAHLGGVHEGWVVGLVVVVLAGFVLAEKRARRLEREQAARDAEPEA